MTKKQKKEFEQLRIIAIKMLAKQVIKFHHSRRTIVTVT